MKKQPWSPPDATDCIREIARRSHMQLSFTRHVRERMEERGLMMDDILHVLKRGFVYENPHPAEPDGFYRYCMEEQTPNSAPRSVRVVVIPDPSGGGSLKIVTVMWVDEK